MEKGALCSEQQAKPFVSGAELKVFHLQGPEVQGGYE